MSLPLPLQALSLLSARRIPHSPQWRMSPPRRNCRIAGRASPLSRSRTHRKASALRHLPPPLSAWVRHSSQLRPPLLLPRSLPSQRAPHLPWLHPSLRNRRSRSLHPSQPSLLSPLRHPSPHPARPLHFPRNPPPLLLPLHGAAHPRPLPPPRPHSPQPQLRHLRQHQSQWLLPHRLRHLFPKRPLPHRLQSRSASRTPTPSASLSSAPFSVWIAR